MKNKKGFFEITGILVSMALFLSDSRIIFAEDGVLSKEIQAETDSRQEKKEDRELEIGSLEEYLQFVKECQNDFYSYELTVSLTTDLDLTHVECKPIPYFNGTFEGNGHTISNMKLVTKGADYGFFRYLGRYAAVRNLTVTGTVTGEGTAENLGGLAGVNEGIISGCSFYGTVKGEKSAGGIAGFNKEEGMILSSDTSGSVTATNRAGGICGENKGIINACTNACTVNGEDLKTTLDLGGIDLGTLNLTQNVVNRNDTGGIAGCSSGTIADCTNSGTIGFAHEGYNVGGIAGKQSGTVLHCNNSGSIMGRKDVGGIVGQAEPYMESEYLSDRLEKLKGDLNRMNQLVVQMSGALSETSQDTKQYTQTLQSQYEDTISSLNDQVNSLRGTLAANNEQTREYMNSISQAMENMGSLGNDTVQRVIDNADSQMKSVWEEVKKEVEEKKPTATPTGSANGTPSASPTENPIAVPSAVPSETPTGTPTEKPTEKPVKEPTKEPDTPDTESTNQPSDNDTDTKEPAAADTNSKTEEDEPEQFILYSGVLPTLSPDDQDKIKDEIKDSLDDLSGKKDRITYEPDPEIKENLDQMQKEISSLSGNIRNMQETISNTGESISDTAGNISGELERNSKASSETIDGMTDSIDRGIQTMAGSLNGIMNTQQNITDYVSDDIDILMGNANSLLDVSSMDVTEKTLGVISGCINRGSIEGDINTGGIAGIMNVEYGIDPELDFDLSKLTDVAVRSTTNDVMIHCINYGKVTAKKNNCGGITGSEELGLIYDCENYGAVSAGNGKNTGGIAGNSVSGIEKCYAFCNIEGKDNLGGIAGSGFNISHCAAMCSFLDAEGEAIGGIAGAVNEEAAISNNYFVPQQWGGIDNINYAGKAISCTYDELQQLTSLPKGFQSVTVTFELEEEILGTVKLPYGSDLRKEDLPKAAVEEDAYLKWDREIPVIEVTENMIMKAEAKRYTLSISSSQRTQSEKPYFLVEGRFYGDTSLEAEAVEMQADGYAFTWSLEHVPTQEERYRVHFLIPEAAQDAQVMVMVEGKYKEVQTVRDGTYLIAEIPYGAAFCVKGMMQSHSTGYAAAGIAGAVFVVFLFVKKKARNIKKSKKK